MGFFSKVKNVMGIGGVKVVLEVPTNVKKDDKQVSGKLLLTSKSDQHILSVEVTLVEEYTTGRGENKDSTEFDLGQYVDNKPFDIKAGEQKEIPFTFNFDILKSENDKLKEKGGVLGAAGKLGSLMDNEKSRYFVKADVDVKGVAFDPGDEKNIKLV